MKKTVYRIDDIYFKYTDNWVLEDISFDVTEGEIFGIIGPNGSGKSSLLKLLSRINISRNGHIYLGGIDISLIRRKELSRTISYVPQESSFLFPYTVSETVLMGRIPHLNGRFFEDSNDKRVVMDAMRAVGIDILKDRPITDISGGEKQRAIIARALAQEANILILDEPTTSLDIGHQIGIFNLLSGLNSERKLTIIISLHDLNLASQYCHRIMLMNRGRVYAIGKPSEVITEENIRDVYGCNVVIDKHPVSGTPRVNLVAGERTSSSFALHNE